MRTFFSILVIAASAVGIVLVLLYFWQSRMILLPGVGDGSGDLPALCAQESATWTRDGKYLGKICEPEGRPRGTIVIYHGNAGTIDDRSFLARALSSRGFRVALAEYPGYGQRDGNATIRQVLAASVNDFEAAMAALPAPLYILGESFGAGIAAKVAEKYPHNVAGLVLVTPWDSLANVVNAILPVPLAFLLVDRFDSVASLSGYRGNVVIVAAEQDEVLPVSHARALAQGAPSAAYFELRGAGHNDWPVYMTGELWDHMIASLTGATQ